jgi:hypothetical protein
MGFLEPFTSLSGGRQKLAFVFHNFNLRMRKNLPHVWYSGLLGYMTL